MRYDVFISYSQATDGLLSERVQSGLARFAKPWWRRRVLTVFRDQSELTANPGLWSSIADAIDNSRYFLLLASPEAAASTWVTREVTQWRVKHGSDRMLVLLTDGEIVWDDEAHDFAAAATTALSATALAGCFAEVPRYVDMRWARAEEQLDLKNGRFRDQIAELAAPVRGVAKDELTGEDVRQYRRTLRQAWIAGVALVAMTLAAVATSAFAFDQAVQASAATTRANNTSETLGVTSKRLKVANATLHKTVNALKRSNRALKRAGHDKSKLTTRVRHELVKTNVANANLTVANSNLDTANSNLDNANSNLATANSSLAAANSDLSSANANLKQGTLALTKGALLTEARLAARRSDQLMSSGGATFDLGVLLAAEAVRHACESSAIDTRAEGMADVSGPRNACTTPGLRIDGSVLTNASLALSSAGSQFVNGRLAGDQIPYHPLVWSSDGRTFATYAEGQKPRNYETVDVWASTGKLVARFTSASKRTGVNHLQPAVALSADGQRVAFEADTPGRPYVGTWDVRTRTQSTGYKVGRLPTLSADGKSMALIELRHPHAVNVWTGTPQVHHRFVLAEKAREVAISADGLLVAVLTDTGDDTYSLTVIDVATGKIGNTISLGKFGTSGKSTWHNNSTGRDPSTSGQPMPGTINADPPALWFAPSGKLWVYTNERHLRVRLSWAALGPTALVGTVKRLPGSVGASTLQASTPDGRTFVMSNAASGQNNCVSDGPNRCTYQIGRTAGRSWKLDGVSPIELCSRHYCDISINPRGTKLVVTSLSALQVIDLTLASSTSSSIVPNQIGARAGDPDDSAVVTGPAGNSALSWGPHSITLVNTCDRSARRVAAALSANEAFTAVGFDPRGHKYVALVTRAKRCPCRALIIDSTSGGVNDNVRLAAIGLPQLRDKYPVGITVNDSSNLLAVTFDSKPHALPGWHRRCAIATYAAPSGQLLQSETYHELGLGELTPSVPAFQPGTDAVALLATNEYQFVNSKKNPPYAPNLEPGGAIVNVRSGDIVTRFSLADGVYTDVSTSLSSTYSALTFSPSGQTLAWNSGGSLAIWDLTATPQRGGLESDVVLDSWMPFDARVLAVANNGTVATVGQSSGTHVVLTGDEHGRLLEPLGTARPFTMNEAAYANTTMSVSIAADDDIVSATLNAAGSEFVINRWASTPAALLDRLCDASTWVLTREEIRTYFPDEQLLPACTRDLGESAWNQTVSPGTPSFAFVPP